MIAHVGPSRRELPSGIVTFLFTDIEGSTSLLRNLGDRYTELLGRHRDILRRVWGAHGGHEVGAEGDAFFVAFAEASDALAACATAQRALADEPWPPDGRIKVRMGLHAGLASPRDGDYVALAVHQAARVVSAAHGGQVLCTDDVAVRAGPLGDTTLQPVGHYRLRDFDEPPALHQLGGRGLAASFPAVRALPADRHNLVRQPNRFVDRETDTARLDQLTGPGRVVSVVGPGGVGKSRLVTEVGISLADTWEDGVWMVELAPLADGAEVPGAISQALGIAAPADAEPIDHVVDHLASKRCLLVLDNCEHLVADVGRVVDRLTSTCSGIGVLATSREPLGLAGEVVCRMEPLEVPASEVGSLEDLGGVAAVELFIDRATAADVAFRVDGGTIGDCVRICRHLDGLPLALELAAARVAVMTPAEIAAGLDDRFRLLRGRQRGIPERHRTMEAMLEWSYRLLGRGEQQVLRSIAVFPTSFTPALAAAAAGQEPAAIVDDLWSLVDKSLLVTDVTGNVTRYRLPESVRAYARHLLDEFGETGPVAARAADRLLERLGPWHAIDRTWLGETASELDNLRGLIGVIDDADQERAQLLACSVGRYHDSVQSFREGVEALERYIDDLPAPGATRVVLLADLGLLHLRTGDTAAAAATLDVAESELTEAGGGLPAWADVAVERLRGELHNRRGEHAAAVATARQALDRHPSQRGTARMSNLLGIASMSLGDLDQAFAAFEQELEAMERLGYELFVASAHGNLAEVAMRQGRFDVAAHHQRECLDLGLALGSPVMVAYSLIVAARLAARGGRWDVATLLHSRADAMLDGTGISLYADDAAASAAMLADAKGHLGQPGFASSQAAGRDLQVHDAAALAGEVFAAHPAV